MSNLVQITQQAARDDVPAPTVERDFVLAHVMAALGAMDDSHCLVIKDGTALTRATGAVEGLNLIGDRLKRIAYRGPLGRQRLLKLDITDDNLVLNVDSSRLFGIDPNSLWMLRPEQRSEYGVQIRPLFTHHAFISLMLIG